MVNKKLTDRVLRKKSDFDNLRSLGRKNSPSRWVTLFSVPNSADHLRFSFTLSRKIGTAVTRNRLRRWGRECFREFLSEQRGLEMGVDINVVFRPMGDGFFKELTHEQYRKTMRKGFAMVQDHFSKPVSNLD